LMQQTNTSMTQPSPNSQVPQPYNPGSNNNFFTTLDDSRMTPTLPHTQATTVANTQRNTAPVVATWFPRDQLPLQ
jgi:hypothetical protein